MKEDPWKLCILFPLGAIALFYSLYMEKYADILFVVILFLVVWGFDKLQKKKKAKSRSETKGKGS